MTKFKSNMINHKPDDAPVTMFFHGVDGALDIKHDDKQAQVANDAADAQRWNAEAQAVKEKQHDASYGKANGICGRVFCK